MRQFQSSMSPKGQITIPLEVRRQWGIKPRDRVTIRVQDGAVMLYPARSPVEESFGAVPPLARELTVEEMTEIAADEHAQETAREGLER